MRSPVAKASPNRPVARVASPSREPERAGTASVEIKADELSARISGCNLAFRALEAELDEKGVWTAARLEPWPMRLKILGIRRHDLNLFREAVPEDKRASIERLASAKTAVSQFAACIVAARDQAKGADFKGTDAERQAELNRLDELSRRLAEWAETVGGGSITCGLCLGGATLTLVTSIGSMISKLRPRRDNGSPFAVAKKQELGMIDLERPTISQVQDERAKWLAC